MTVPAGACFALAMPVEIVCQTAVNIDKYGIGVEEFWSHKSYLVAITNRRTRYIQTGRRFPEGGK
jgi:hypothetical protein